MLKGKRRESIIIATKFAWLFDKDGKPVQLDSSPAHIKESIEGSLKRLGTDYIDLYYQHRLDPNTPIEDTVGTMADLGERRQGAVYRPVRSWTRNHSSRSCHPSAHGRSVGIFAVGKRH